MYENSYNVEAASDITEGKLSRTASMFDLTQFDLKDMTLCTAALRRFGADATNMEEVAGQVVGYLYEQLRDSSTGEHQSLLVRLFGTYPFDELDAERQQRARVRLNGQSVPLTLKCFTLLGTAGRQPEWNRPECSSLYQVVPLFGRQFIDQMPMMSQLFTQFGVKIEALLPESSDALLDQNAKTFNVFYIEEALGSPYVPAQEDFVKPYGVRSVLGVGGLLSQKTLFAMIMFSRVVIPKETAEMFKTVAIAIKLALMPFEGAAFLKLHSPQADEGVRPCAQ